MSTIVCDGYGGSENIELWCCLCKKETMHDVGYLGTRCQECRLDWSPIDGEIGRVALHIKRKNNFTWEEFGEKLGLKGSSLRTYTKKDSILLFKHLVKSGFIMEKR